MRKALCAIFIGIVVVGWITFCITLLIVPFNKLVVYIAGHNSNHSVFDQSNMRHKVKIRKAKLPGIKNIITLTLDATWLSRLQETVAGNEEAFCCIVPADPTKQSMYGTAECEISSSTLKPFTHQSQNKKNAIMIKCKTNLVYNFRFTPNKMKYDFVEK